MLACYGLEDALVRYDGPEYRLARIAQDVRISRSIFEEPSNRMGVLVERDWLEICLRVHALGVGTILVGS